MNEEVLLLVNLMFNFFHCLSLSVSYGLYNAEGSSQLGRLTKAL